MKSPTESEVFRRFFHAGSRFFLFFAPFLVTIRFVSSRRSSGWKASFGAERVARIDNARQYRIYLSEVAWVVSNIFVIMRDQGEGKWWQQQQRDMSQCFGPLVQLSPLLKKIDNGTSRMTFSSPTWSRCIPANERIPHRGGPISKRFPPLLVTLKMVGCFSLLFCGLHFGNTHDHASANHGYRGRWIPSWRRGAARTMAASRSARRTFNRFVTARSWVPENEGL